jgi:hypothetical protein
MSGLSYDYNTKRMFLNRATDVRLDKGNGEYEEIDKPKEETEWQF